LILFKREIGKAETDKILMRTEQFMIVQDWKWGGDKLVDLHFLVIPFTTDLKSIRDLDDSHIPLLSNMKAGILSTASEQFGIKADKLSLYFHYQPTYYHLHVHVTHTDNSDTGGSNAVYLDTVLSNLTLLGNYYKRVSMTFTLSDTHELAAIYS